MDSINLLDGMETKGEGHIGMYYSRINILQKQLKKFKPQYILEVGFNLGHSMKLIIDTLYSIPNYKGIKKFYTFDICEGINDDIGCGGGHNYVKKNFEIMKNHYNNIDIQLIEGDSLVTLKTFVDNLEHELDFIEIDGCHSGIRPYYDMKNTMNKLKVNGFMYIDDYNKKYKDIFFSVDKLFKDTSKWELIPGSHTAIVIKKS
jgi:hypothetical protein